MTFNSCFFSVATPAPRLPSNYIPDTPAPTTAHTSRETGFRTSGEDIGKSGEYVGSSSQYFGSGSQNVGSSGQYVRSSGQYVGSSGQYVGNSGQYMGSSSQNFGSSVQKVGRSGESMGKSGQDVSRSGAYIGGSGDAGESYPYISRSGPSKETTFTTATESSVWPPPDFRPKVISVTMRTHDGEEKNSPYAVTPDQIVRSLHGAFSKD